MHIFLSPHFDDAVYSCGGLIHQLRQRGETVQVITVMGGDLPHPLPQSPIVNELHTRWQAGENPIATRQEEDREAIQNLHAQLTQLPIMDCIYRTVNDNALYPDEASLWGVIHSNDPAIAYLQNFASLGAQWVAPFAEDGVFYAPLGVGHHVDHRLVRDWAIQTWQVRQNFTLKFYTDYPYMRDAHKIDEALADVAKIRGVGAKLLAPLQAEWVLLSEADLLAKIDGIATYRSQISTFWDDEAHMRADVRQFFRDGAGNPAERFWQIA
jgi:LmbE family N-acetylglucosaminyl deacetylase